MEVKKTKIINLYGSPGAGKTTITCELFSLMKRKRYNVELALEYAKELVWEESFTKLENQLLVFSEQQNRINRLIGKVDYIITDSPLLLSIVYNKNNENLNELVLSEHYKHDNINFFIERGKQSYEQNGRLQNEDESRLIGDKICDLLDKEKIEYYLIINDENSAKDIFDIISNK